MIEYEDVVLRHALRLATQECAPGRKDDVRKGAGLRKAPCSELFNPLQVHRRRERIPDDVHAQVMERLGIDEEASIREGVSLVDVCKAAAASPMPHLSVSLRRQDSLKK